MMKVSIWQQFASNHSGYFWVTGLFRSLDEARTAYDTLRRILFEIDRWHREHKEESAEAMRTGNYAALPPEAAISVQYNVEWPHTIDWTNFAAYGQEGNPVYASLRPAQVRSQELIDEAVSRVGRAVTISNPDQTWMTTQPFQGLLERFGAQTIGYDLDNIPSDDFELHALIRFSAPDQVVADRIDGDLNTYQNGMMSLDPSTDQPPWHDDSTNFAHVFGGSSILTPDEVRILLDNWERDYELALHVPALRQHASIMLKHRLQLSSSQFRIKRDNLDFVLEDIWFHNQELGVSALIAYLEANGCLRIDYEYRTLPSDVEE